MQWWQEGLTVNFSFSSNSFLACSDAPRACFKVAACEASNVACLEIKRTRRRRTLNNDKNKRIYHYFVFFLSFYL